MINLNTHRSQELFERASRHFPLGVSSPVRYFQPFPIFMKRASGSRLWDVDGNEYIDFNMGFGPSILGHADPDVLKFVEHTMEDGLIFGTPSELELDLADLLQEADPNLEMVRFCNSGTEATMHAIRLSRGYTNRKLIVKMEGGFHGSHDYALIKSGSGGLTFGMSSSAGVPEEVGRTVLIASFNDLDGLRKLFREHGDQIACVITEPVFGNTGVIEPDEGFLEGIRDLCTQYGSLFVLDEVITGFRFGFSTYQRLANVEADLTILGKIVGGGLPIGVFGGSSEIMKMVAPSGKVYVSGTFSGNPISMSSGVATLRKLRRTDYSSLLENTMWVREQLEVALKDIHGRGTVNAAGSMFQIFPGTDRVRTYSDAMGSDSVFYMRLFRKLLQDGVYLAPGQYETNFLSFAHTRADLEQAVRKTKKALLELSPP